MCSIHVWWYEGWFVKGPKRKYYHNIPQIVDSPMGKSTTSPWKKHRVIINVRKACGYSQSKSIGLSQSSCNWTVAASPWTAGDNRSLPNYDLFQPLWMFPWKPTRTLKDIPCSASKLKLPKGCLDTGYPSSSYYGCAPHFADALDGDTLEYIPCLWKTNQLVLPKTSKNLISHDVHEKRLVFPLYSNNGFPVSSQHISITVPTPASSPGGKRWASCWLGRNVHAPSPGRACRANT